MTFEPFNILMILIGLFTLALGIVHFFFPALLDYKNAIRDKGSEFTPFKLGFIRYKTQWSDIYGLIWVMNHAASYTIVTVGILDLLSYSWIHTNFRQTIALWIAIWWFLRAGTQFYLGSRRGDMIIASCFSFLGFVHLLIFLDRL